jgi:hypothetical protein
MARQRRRMQPKERETGGGTGANRTALGISQARDIRNNTGEPMADREADNTWEKGVAEEERDVTMTETAGETKMGAASSNNYSNSAQLCQVVRVDNSGAGDRGGTKGGRSVLARATKRKKRIRNLAHSI